MKRRILTFLVILSLAFIEIGAARDIGAGSRANYRPAVNLFDGVANEN